MWHPLHVHRRISQCDPGDPTIVAVVAGSAKEFDEWMKRHDDGVTPYLYIGKPEDAMGWITTRMKNYVVTGSARSREDYDDIMTCIHTNLRRDK